MDSESQAGQDPGRTRIPGIRSSRAFLALQTVLLVVSLTAVWYFAAGAGALNVTVAAPDREVVLKTRCKTVEDALKEAGLCLSPGDVTVPAVSEPLTQGMQIAVCRAQPVFLTCDGKTQAFMTCVGSVASVLDQACVELGPDDFPRPAMEDEIPSDRRISVVRVAYKEEALEEKLPYGRETRNDASMEAGLTRVYRSGQSGVVKVTYSVRYEDGQEVSRQEIGRDKVKDPSPEIVLVGVVREVSRGGENIRFKKAVEVQSTAYCPCAKCCGAYANGVTHIGVPATRGVIAVDPRVIPLGTRVYVDGYGFALAADTGGAIKGSRIDVCFDTHSEALSWGLKKTKVYILE